MSSKWLSGNVLSVMSPQLTIYVHSTLIIVNAKNTNKYMNQTNYILLYINIYIMVCKDRMKWTVNQLVVTHGQSRNKVCFSSFIKECWWSIYFFSYINIIVIMCVVDEGRMKSTWRSWLFPNIIFLSSKCGASPPGWATWEITEFPTHQQYKIDVYINLYSSGKLLTLGWETNHIVVIAGVLEIPWFPGWPNQVVRHHT